MGWEDDQGWEDDEDWGESEPGELDDYFVELRAFREARSKRDYLTALVHLRQGLKEMKKAISEFQAEPGMRRISFIESPGGAVAALFDDEESFRLMEGLDYTHGKRTFDVARYRRDAQVVKQILRILEETPLTALSEIRRQLDPEDAPRLGHLAGYMRKHGSITIEGTGPDAVVFLGAAAPPPPVPELPTFRAGQTEVPCPLFVPTSRPLGEDFDPRGSRQGSWPPPTYPHLDEAPLPTAQRQPGVMETYLCAEGTWLLGTSKEQPDGSRATTVRAYHPDGSFAHELKLSHHVARAWSSRDRREIVTADRELNIRVYDFEGNRTAALSLADTPEVAGAVSRINEDLDSSMQATAIASLRCVDVSLQRGEIIFSIQDRCWWFGLDGSLILAFRVPIVPFYKPGPSVADATKSEMAIRGIDTDTSPRELAAMLDSQGQAKPMTFLGASLSVSAHEPDEDEEAWPWDENDYQEDSAWAETALGQLKPDWIYFLRFADRGDKIWLSTYSGLTFLIDRRKRIRAAWLLPWLVLDILVRPTEVLAFFVGGVAQIAPGIAPMLLGSPTPGLRVVGPNQAVWRDGRNIEVMDLETREVDRFTLRRDFRAAYPAGPEMRLETKTSVATVGETAP